MTSIIRAILFKEFPPPPDIGRSVRFDVSDPDVRYSQGPIPTRILGYVRSRGEPLTAKEIAQGIDCTTSCVYVNLKNLVNQRSLDVISVAGSHPEYVLARKK